MSCATLANRCGFLSVVAAAGLSYLGVSWLVDPRADSPKAAALSLCSMMVACGVVLKPAATDRRSIQLFNSICWSAALGLTASVTLRFTDPSVGLGQALMLGCAVGAMILPLTSLTHLLEASSLGHAARPIVIVAVALASTTPLWLGPAALRLGSQGFTNAVVSISPLSCLAAVCDYDYLRSNWFYANSPVGSLRFAYPKRDCLLALAGLVLAAIMLEKLLRRRGR